MYFVQYLFIFDNFHPFFILYSLLSLDFLSTKANAFHLLLFVFYSKLKKIEKQIYLKIKRVKMKNGKNAEWNEKYYWPTNKEWLMKKWRYIYISQRNAFILVSEKYSSTKSSMLVFVPFVPKLNKDCLFFHSLLSFPISLRNFFHFILHVSLFLDFFISFFLDVIFISSFSAFYICFFLSFLFFIIWLDIFNFIFTSITRIFFFSVSLQFLL